MKTEMTFLCSTDSSQAHKCFVCEIFVAALTRVRALRSEMFR